jgi:hypothetical protein
MSNEHDLWAGPVAYQGAVIYPRRARTWRERLRRAAGRFLHRISEMRTVITDTATLDTFAPAAADEAGADPTAAWADEILTRLGVLMDRYDELANSNPPPNPDASAELRELRRLCGCASGLDPLQPGGNFAAWRAQVLAKCEMAVRQKFGRLEDALIRASNRARQLTEQGADGIIIPAKLTLQRNNLWPGLSLVDARSDPRLAAAVPPNQRLGSVTVPDGLYLVVGWAGHHEAVGEVPRPTTLDEVRRMTAAVRKHRNHGAWTPEFLECARRGDFEPT